MFRSSIPGSTSLGPKSGASTAVALSGSQSGNGTGAIAALQNKNSMLDKLKFFNSKDKSEKGKEHVAVLKGVNFRGILVGHARA